MDNESDNVALRNLRFGWWALLCFLSLGGALEVLHGYKIGWYLDVSNETRRLMFTLSHAHGTLISLINIAFGLTMATLPELRPRRMRLTSSCLIAATVIMPGGFLLAGVVIYSGDPGLGILLVPIGALLLGIGVLTAALAVCRHSE